MTLSKREKVLAGFVGLFVLLVGGRLLLFAVTAVSERRTAVGTLNEKIVEKQEQVDSLLKAREKLDDWRRRALPSEPKVARTLYQDWLVALGDRAKFRNLSVKSSEPRELRGVFTRLPFTITGKGTLGQLVQFLYDFYSAGHLQQVTKLTIKPAENSKELDLFVDIEALSLPNADRRDKLAQAASGRLKLAGLAAYNKAISDRNPFAPYSPSREKPRELEPKVEPFDPSKYAFVTGIVDIDGEPEAWIQARTTDQKFRLRAGQQLEVGPLKGTITRIGTREIEMKIDGKTDPISVPLGDQLKKTEKEAAKPGEPPAKPAGPEGKAAGPGEKFPGPEMSPDEFREKARAFKGKKLIPPGPRPERRKDGE